MSTKFYKSITTGVVMSLLLTLLTIAPVSARSSASTNQVQNPCAALAKNLGLGQGQIAKAGLGTGPGTAATPISDCWLAIAPGQKQWYRFHVGARSNKGDQNNNFNNSNGVDDSDAAIAQLVMNTAGCVTFEIWTLARLNAPAPVSSKATTEEKRQDKEVARGPVGAGSPEFAIVNDNTENSSSNNTNDNARNDKNRDLARLIWRGGSTVPENFYIAVRNARTDFACTYRLAVAGPTVTFPGAGQ